MSLLDWVEILFFIGMLVLAFPLFGAYIAFVFQRKQYGFSQFLEKVENLFFRICRINPNEEMTWREYAHAVLWFNGLGIFFVFCILIFQGVLPLNPQKLPGVPPLLAFNTAISFATNTNWQAYAGETTMSYFSQMTALTVQNFLSAATGMAVLVAFIRGFTRKLVSTIGNFWADMTRTVLYILLPLSVLLSFFLVQQGSIQTLAPYAEVVTLENKKQTIPLGPVASQVAIKQLGTNGGGFFNANSAHPFENPTGLTNMVEALAILLIPAASVYAFGVMIGNRKQGLILYHVMFSLWLAGLCISLWAQGRDNPVIDAWPVLEGLETRFGVGGSMLWSTSTTATANGSVNAMMSSLSPLAGGVAMMNIMLGEVVFGGVGVGLCGMLAFCLLSVFLCGLMVGRTPEFLCKKVEKREIQWVLVIILFPSACILIGAGIACVLPVALQSLSAKGPHGLSEILYAFASAAENNGSSFAGLNANTPFYNTILGITMLACRLAVLIPSLAIAGSLASKRTMDLSHGGLRTDTLLFGLILLFVILIVGSLTFFPAVALGPIIEHMMMVKGVAG